MQDSFSHVNFEEINKPPLVYNKGDNKIIGESENPFERVKNYYIAVLTGVETGEAFFTTHCIATSLTIGFIYGSSLGARRSIDSFIRKHNDYKFEGKTEAAQKLANATMSHFVRNGCSYSLKLGLYTSYFTLFTFSSIIFRNDINYLDFAFGGSMAGAIYKIPLGPKGMVSGAIFSSIFGLIGASLVKSILWLSGHHIVELRAVLNQALIEHREKKKQSNAKQTKILSKLFSSFEPLIYNVLTHEKRLEKLKKETSEQK